MKALDFGGETFQEIRLMFPKLSEAKIKGGIFVGPQVKAMLKSEKLERAMTKVEKEAWCAFRDVVCGFLGNYKDPNYKQLVAKLIENFKKLGCRMSLTYSINPVFSLFKDFGKGARQEVGGYRW